MKQTKPLADPKYIGKLFCEMQEMMHDLDFVSALEHLRIQRITDVLDKENFIAEDFQEKTR